MVVIPEIPARVAVLPRDERGYPVPFFVSWIKGKPEFRIADTDKFAQCLEDSVCWVCGQKLGVFKSFVTGPLALINRNHAEPPCHLDCAEFSAKVCPFLSKPKSARRTAGMPEESLADTANDKNPGVTLIYTTKSYEPYYCGQEILFELGEPTGLKWFREGRPARWPEILEALNKSAEFIRGIAAEDGDLARFEEMFSEAIRIAG